MNLYEKLIEVRKSLPYFQKNKQGFGYKYVKGQDILAKVQEKTNELKILFFPQIVNYEIIEVDTGKKNDKKPEVSEFTYIFKSSGSSMKIVDAETGEILEIPFAFIGSQPLDPAKAYGSALTYSERYFLMKFFNIPTDEDDPDKWEDKHTPDESIDDKIESMFQNLKDNFLHPSEIESFEQQILEAHTDKKKKALISFFESRLKGQTLAQSITPIKTKIVERIKELGYEDTHRVNSFKKHLGTDTLKECQDIQKLSDYLTHLTLELQNKGAKNE